MSEFRMPSLGADLEFGTLVYWRVKPGDAVKRGDVVALVETEKGVIEVEIFETGVIDSLIVQPGQKVPVGATLALVRSDGKTAEVQPAPAAAPPSEAKAAVEELRPATIAPPTELPGRARVSPLARKRAQELGVELSAVTGIGEAGSITASDVEKAAAIKTAAEPPAPAAPTVAAKGLDLQAMRRVIAAA